MLNLAPLHSKAAFSRLNLCSCIITFVTEKVVLLWFLGSAVKQFFVVGGMG